MLVITQSVTVTVFRSAVVNVPLAQTIADNTPEVAFIMPDKDVANRVLPSMFTAP